MFLTPPLSTKSLLLDWPVTCGLLVTYSVLVELSRVPLTTSRMPVQSRGWSGTCSHTEVHGPHTLGWDAWPRRDRAAGCQRAFGCMCVLHAVGSVVGAHL